MYTYVVDAGSGVNHTVAGLTEGRVYYFVMTAYDALGNESGLSAEVEKTVAGGSESGGGDNGVSTSGGGGCGVIRLDQDQSRRSTFPLDRLLWLGILVAPFIRKMFAWKAVGAEIYALRKG